MSNPNEITMRSITELEMDLMALRDAIVDESNCGKLKVLCLNLKVDLFAMKSILPEVILPIIKIKELLRLQEKINQLYQDDSLGLFSKIQRANEILNEDKELLKKYPDSRMLGKGSFGVVIQVGQNCIKRVYRHTPRELCMNELVLCDYLIGHPLHHVVKIFSVDKEAREITMEYCDGGTLENALQSHEFKYPVVDVVDQLFSMLESLDAHSLMHKDLTARNILIQKDPLLLKLSDFGLATMDFQNPWNFRQKNASAPSSTLISSTYDLRSIGHIIWLIGLRTKLNVIMELGQKVKSGQGRLETLTMWAQLRSLKLM